MGQIIKLGDVIKTIHKYDDEMTIYAEKPWNPDSLAIVELEPECEDRPRVAIDRNLDYFLEIFVAIEFIDGFLSNLKKQPSNEDICQHLISYASHDA